MSERLRLEAIREVRFLPDEAFDGITEEELEQASRWLTAAAYSAKEGARRIERLREARSKAATAAPNTCPTEGREESTP